MIYLTGRKHLNDDSDNEDPNAALNIAADNREQIVDSDGEDEEEGIYSANNA
jgi:hypothetical protein